MLEENPRQLIEESGNIARGHFVLASGEHSPAYISHWGILSDSLLMGKLTPHLADFFLNYDVETVAGPARGGNILSVWVAAFLSQATGKNVHSIYTEKSDVGFTIPQELCCRIKDKKVLIVEDVMTTGESVLKLARTIKQIGGLVAGFGAIWDRGLNSYFAKALVQEEIPSWPEEDCYMCRQGIPVDLEMGHGKEFLAQKRLQQGGQP